MKIYLLILSFLIIANTLFADEQRIETSFKSENNKFTLQFFGNSWKLKNEKGKTLYSIKDENYSSMTIFISNDGNRLTIIDDFVEGHSIGEKAVLRFFKKGKIMMTYKLTDLLSDTCNIEESIWHTTWTLDDFGFLKSDSIFSIATFEFNEMEFDTYSGKILKNQKPYPFDENTLIVSGYFYKSDSPLCNLKIQRYIYGIPQANNEVIFTTNAYGKGNWHRTLMIREGKDVTPNRFMVMLPPNGCTN